MKHNKHRRLFIAGLMLLSSLLTACGTAALSIETKATLYTEEYWEAETTLVYAAQQIQLTGSLIDQSFATALAQWQAQGLNAQLNKSKLDNGNSKYRLTISGQGFAKLNSALFDGTAQIAVNDSSNPPQITFQWTPLGSLFGIALSRTFILKGGKILTGNGSILNDTISWINPTQPLQATLTPASRFNLPLTLGVMGGVALVGGLSFFAIRTFNQTKCPNCGTTIPRNAEFCPECGGTN